MCEIVAFFIILLLIQLILKIRKELSDSNIKIKNHPKAVKQKRNEIKNYPIIKL